MTVSYDEAPGPSNEMKAGMTNQTLFLNRGDRRLSASGPLFMIRARRDFLRAQSQGVKRVTPGFVLHIFVRRNAGLFVTATPRAGFTASKKVGGAVQRNLAKRRMRALMRDIIAPEARQHYDYVIVARVQIVTRAYTLLEKDIKEALSCLYTTLDGAGEKDQATDGQKKEGQKKDRKIGDAD